MLRTWRVMRKSHLNVYVGALSGLAIAVAASWGYWYSVVLEPRFIVGTLVLASLILLGEIFPIRVSGLSTIGVWDIGLVVAVVALGPSWAAIAALPAAALAAKRDWLRLVFEAGHSIIIVHVAGIVFLLVSPPLLSGTSAPNAPVMYGTFAAGLTLLASNKVIMIVLLKIKYGRSVRDTWKDDMEPYLLSDAANILTAGLGVLVFLVYGPVAAIIVVGGAIGSQVLVFRLRDQAERNRRLRTRVESLEEALAKSNTAFGTTIIRELGRRDGYTHRHAIATAVYAEDLGREMKLDEARVGRLRMAGLLHNVGMFELPEDLLLATGKLNSIAQHQVYEHPALGERVLAAVPEFEEMASWVRWHHERPDGRGYPDKLRGPWIPTEAKILTAAQSYAAMILDQPRRPGMDPSEARGNLGAGIDTQFDGVVVRAFLRILDTESEGYRMADDHRFVFPDGRREIDASGPETAKARGRKNLIR